MKKTILTIIALIATLGVYGQNVDLRNSSDYIRVQKNGETGYTRAFGLNSSNSMYIGSVEKTIGDIYFYNSGTNHLMTLKPNGFVGIGTTVPNSMLTVQKNFNGTTALQIVNNSTGPAARSGILIGNGNPGGSVNLLSTSASYNEVGSWSSSGVLSTDSQLSNGLVLRTHTGEIRFQPGGISDRMVFTQNGNLLIGKASQVNTSYKLDIDGKIRANEIVVNTNGADYVFEPGYDIPKLEFLEQFIKENNHLPGIPSASKMQQEGVALADLNTKLLQKIEELTLYIIDQNKAINRLENEVREIKGQKEK